MESTDRLGSRDRLVKIDMHFLPSRPTTEYEQALSRVVNAPYKRATADGLNYPKGPEFSTPLLSRL